MLMDTSYNPAYLAGQLRDRGREMINDLSDSFAQVNHTTTRIRITKQR